MKVCASTKYAQDTQWNTAYGVEALPGGRLLDYHWRQQLTSGNHRARGCAPGSVRKYWPLSASPSRGPRSYVV